MKILINVFQLFLVALSFFSLNVLHAAEYEPGSETSFTLIKPLTIPANAASIYIQGSTATRSEARIDQYAAFCLFEQDKKVKVDTDIKPQKFIVTDTRLSKEQPTWGVYSVETLFYLTSENSKKKIYTRVCFMG